MPAGGGCSQKASDGCCSECGSKEGLLSVLELEDTAYHVARPAVQRHRNARRMLVTKVAKRRDKLRPIPVYLS